MCDGERACEGAMARGSRNGAAGGGVPTSGLSATGVWETGLRHSRSQDGDGGVVLLEGPTHSVGQRRVYLPTSRGSVSWEEDRVAECWVGRALAEPCLLGSVESEADFLAGVHVPRSAPSMVPPRRHGGAAPTRFPPHFVPCFGCFRSMQSKGFVPSPPVWVNIGAQECSRLIAAGALASSSPSHCLANPSLCYMYSTYILLPSSSSTPTGRGSRDVG
ncbi:hypothetical protein VTI74DRAFT_3982 [Chaetomium olivicolor]